MSKKDLEQYYNQMTAQYKDLQKEVHEFEQDAANNMMPPEALQDFKDSISPFMVNWQRVTYLMYLLHKPVKKEKQEQYADKSKPLLEKVGKENTGESVLEENTQIIEKVKHERKSRTDTKS